MRIEVGQDALATGDDPERVEFVVHGQLVAIRQVVIALFLRPPPQPTMEIGRLIMARRRVDSCAARGLNAEPTAGLSLQPEGSRGVQVLTLDEVDIKAV